MTPVLVSLLSKRRGGLGVSTWLVDDDVSVFASTSFSSCIGIWPEGTLELGLLPPGPATGRPKKEFLGETMPGETALGVVEIEGGRYMLLTTFAAPGCGMSEVERRCV